MFSIIAVLTGTMLRVFRTRRNLLLENLVLRHQLTVLKRKRPRPRIAALDKLFWVFARRFWSGWKQALIVVTPDTVVRWHRAGFALYWRVISRARRVTGRRRISKEVRDLIFRMMIENPTWGAPRIHGELLMLGVDISERTISRWMRRAPRDPEPAKRWLAFLRNHREAIAAMDFFTVPTITFGVLYCFFIIGHDRRRILYFHVTRHPASLWVVQQLREAFPYETAPRFLIFDQGCQVWDGSSCCDSVDENQVCPHFIRESLAEWRCRALGPELPPRLAGSRDRFGRGPFTSIAFRLCPLLPRRPNPSRTEKGNTGGQNSFAGLRSHHCS